MLLGIAKTKCPKIQPWMKGLSGTWHMQKTAHADHLVGKY